MLYEKREAEESLQKSAAEEVKYHSDQITYYMQELSNLNKMSKQIQFHFTFIIDDSGSMSNAIENVMGFTKELIDILA
jgi:hypothetical protein